MSSRSVTHEGFMTRSQVRQRVNAAIVPGQERQKHVMVMNKPNNANRMWIWDYCANYKGATVFLCMTGIMLSVYALVVEFHKEANPKYEAMCDINEAMSCTKVLTSRWGKGFGIIGHFLGDDHPLNLRNPFFGITFYILQLVLSDSKGSWGYKLQLFTCILANLGSVWLAYILYFVLADFCLVCVTTYVNNFLLLLANVARFRHMRRIEESKKQ